MLSGLIKSTDGQQELSVDASGKLSAASFTNDSGTFTLSPNSNNGAKLDIISGGTTKTVYIRIGSHQDGSNVGVLISSDPSSSSGILIGSSSIDIL